MLVLSRGRRKKVYKKFMVPGTIKKGAGTLSVSAPFFIVLRKYLYLILRCEEGFGSGSDLHAQKTEHRGDDSEETNQTVDQQAEC